MNNPLGVFGQVLRRWRIERGYSALKMASCLGLTPQAVYNLEGGRFGVSPDTFSRLPEDLRTVYLALCGNPVAPGTGPKPKAVVLTEAKERRCLKCRERFRSRHYGNRLCEPCGKYASSNDDGGVYRTMTSRRTGGAP